MDLNLSGKVAIVTGGAQGIGRAIVNGFVREGSNVALVDLNAEDGRLSIEGREVLSIKADVSNPADCNEAVSRTVGEFGKIDILVNNAGVFALSSFLKLGRPQIEREINTNYYGVINFTRAVLQGFVDRKSGVILAVSSDAGKVGEPKQPIYSGTKAAVNAFFKALAKDYGRFNVRFNTVSPAFTTSEGALALFENPEDVISSDKFLASYPLRKVVAPEDVANLVLFLASERGGNITGQAISVNGGFCMV